MCLHDVLADLIGKAKSGSYSVAFNALVEISKLCRKDTTAVANFSQLKGISVLLELIEKPRFSDISLSILANCCLNEQVRDEVIKSNGVRSLVRVLSCIEKESIRNRACRGLANVSLTSRGAREVHRCSAVKHIVEFLTSTQLLDSELTALRALRILANSSQYRDDLVRHMAPAAVAKLLPKESIQKAALQALACITQSCTVECAMQVKDADGLTALGQLLCSPNVAILEAAFTVLVNLSVVGEVRPDLGAVGAVERLVMQLNNYQLTRPSYASLFSALCRYSQESVNRIRVRECGGLCLLVEVLRDTQRKDLWPCTVCAILQFRYDSGSLELLWDSELISVIMSHVQDYVQQHKQENHAAHSTENQDTNAHSTGYQTGESIPEASSADNGFSNNGNVGTGGGGANDKNIVNKDDLKGSTPVKAIQSDLSEARFVERDHMTTKIHGEEEPPIFGSDGITKADENTRGNLSEDDFSDLDTLEKVDNKVFCIHSPSYREIQEENTLDHSSRTFSVDSGYHSYHSSPNSPEDRLASSPQSSFGSPRSQDSGLWSPGSSTRCESPVSVASPEIFRCFSPVCSDNDEDNSNSINEGAPVNEEKIFVPQTGSQSAHRTSQFIKRKKLEFRDGAVDQASKYDMLSGSASCSLADGVKRRKRTPSKPSSSFMNNPGDALLDAQLRVLSVFSLLEGPKYEHVALPLFRGLLEYLRLVPQPLRRAIQVVLRVASNVHAFESLVCAQDVLLLVDSAQKQCHLESCRRCTSFAKLARDVLSKLTSVAQSGFGSGVLAHCLLTGEKPIRRACCLTTPHLVRNKLILRRLLFDCSGLELLLDILEEDKDGQGDFDHAVESLHVLFARISLPQDFGEMHADQEEVHPVGNCCHLTTYPLDIRFRLDDGATLEGNRKMLSQASDYFRRMLQGHFQERDEDIVAFRCTRHTPLNVVLHHLHGCASSTCPFLRDQASEEGDLDTLTICHQLLLPQLQKEVEAKVKRNMKSQQVCKTYTRALELGMDDLRKAVVCFLLRTEPDHQQRCKCLRDLLAGPSGGQVLDDVVSLLQDYFVQSSSPLRETV